jgi:hypothetical protein
MTTIKPRTVTVDLYQGDHIDRLRHLEARHKAALAAEGKTKPLASEVPESQIIAEEHAALRAEADEEKLVVVLGALGRKAWRALVKQHPPRKAGVNGATEAQAESDEATSVNEDTFKDELVPLSILSPELTEEDLDALSDGQFDALYLNAFALNRTTGGDPKDLVSPVSRESTKNSAT